MNVSYTTIVKQLVDDLKAISANAGLGGEAGEYNLVTQSFLYKFLNDKFLFEIRKIHPDYDYEKLSNLGEDDYTMLLDFELGTNTAHLHPRHLIEYLYNHQNEDDFAKTFDDTLNDIAVENNSIFSVHTAGNSDIRLFEERLINDIVRDNSMRNKVAKQIISKLALIKFDEAIFDQGFDFFSTIFEYMIKDYNKDGGGKYAEYYTPHSVAKIMAEILIGDDQPKSVTAYDPSAGSGTLLMNVASKIGTDKVSIYSQDISQKSSNLLRLNLILNNLSHSINNIVQGNTIIENRHADKKMDYIVSNPPFKLDFSEWQEQVSTLPEYNDRFFAGVPKIPKSAKDKMAIYLLFIQHIIYSLNDCGKATVVVPTSFLTAQSAIEKKIRKHLIDNRWLKGAVSMPSNIFATTDTNVSVIFIDKTNSTNDAKVILVSAGKLGKKVRDGKNQKTVLNNEDEQKIIDAFTTQQAIDDFSVILDYKEIAEKNYSFSAGQYFDIKIEYEDITQKDFEDRLSESNKKLNDLFAAGNALQEEILNNLTMLKFDDSNI